MTVCIAAIAENNTIVTVSDLKVTKGFYSSDLVTLKTETFHPKWTAFLAGKIARGRPLARDINLSLDSKKDYLGEQIADVCTKQYISHQQKVAYEKVLSSFGLTFQSFLTKRTELGDAVFERLWSEISRVQLELELLVVGFEHGDHPRVFVIANPTSENPSFTTYCDNEGFAAIGTGAYLADSTLFSVARSLGKLEETIYWLLAAKFQAESASDVGEITYVKILKPDGSQGRLDPDIVQGRLRKEWEKYGRPRMRPQAEVLIHEALEKNIKQLRVQK